MASVNQRVLPGFSLSLGYTVFYLSALVLIPLVYAVLQAFTGPLDVDAAAKDILGATPDAAFWVRGGLSVLGAPVVEELFFRGLLLRSLTTSVGIGTAIVIQAVLFGCAHLSPLLGLANESVMTVITAAGVVFGITAWKRRVATSVAAHSFFNMVAVAVAFALR